MNHNIEYAKKLLMEGQYTCVLCEGEKVHTSKERGVKPLLQWLRQGRSMKGYSAADKVVGNATAFLYVLLQVKEVYGIVMSEAAEQTLRTYGITPIYETRVPTIINRAGTGPCPMEQAVKDATSPTEALEAIQKKLKELQ